MAEESIQKHIIGMTKRMQDVMGDAPGGDVTGQSKSKNQKNLAQQLKKLAGIDLGLGALLKQSQIFTGYMGNLFAIIGAIIDTVLAPLAPMAFKALAALGKKIPAIAKMAEEWIPKIVEFSKKMVTGFDDFMKKWAKLNWAGNVARIVGILIAINLGIKFLRMSGSLAYGITGARGMVGAGKGAVGMTSRLMGRGGAAAAASQASRAATPVVAGGGGMGGFARRIIGGGGKGGAPVQDAKGVWRVPKGALGGGQFAAAPSAGKVASRVGMRAIGKGLMTKIPIIGAVTSGIFGYAEGRNQGYSVGKSVAKGGFSMGGMLGGAAAGAAIGSIIPGPGTLIGGLIGGGLGAFGGAKLFDMMFGGKGGGGGGDSSNLGVGGGVGLSGYSVPTFIAMSAEAMSEPVVKYGFVIDEGILALNRLETATDGAATSLGEYSAGMLEYIEKTGGMDQPDDDQMPPGFTQDEWGGASVGGLTSKLYPSGGVAALEAERVIEAQAVKDAGYLDLPDTFEGTGGASTAVGQGYFRDFSRRNQKENDAALALDALEVEGFKKQYAAQRLAEAQDIEDAKWKPNKSSEMYLQEEGLTISQKDRSEAQTNKIVDAVNALGDQGMEQSLGVVNVTTDQPPATSIGNSWGKYDMYGGEDPWR